MQSNNGSLLVPLLFFPCTICSTEPPLEVWEVMGPEAWLPLGHLFHLFQFRRMVFLFRSRVSGMPSRWPPASCPRWVISKISSSLSYPTGQFFRDSGLLTVCHRMFSLSPKTKESRAELKDAHCFCYCCSSKVCLPGHSRKLQVYIESPCSSYLSFSKSPREEDLVTLQGVSAARFQENL